MSGEGDVADFMGITGCSTAAAQRILEMCGGDLEQAVTLWYTDDDLQRYLETTPAAEEASATAATAPPTTSRPSGRQTARQIAREDENGVIHIESDDDDQSVAMEIDDGSDLEDNDARVAATVARTAQEEEDAAMAQRLQDQLYNNQPAGEEAIRAPISRTTETLVDPAFLNYGEDDAGPRAVELAELRRRNRAQAARTHNPFGQSVWDDSSQEAPARPGGLPTGPHTSRANRLADMFRPPYELMSQLSWDEARVLGKGDKKWIMVNLQDMSDFHCQALNRDIWKDEAIVELVSENFIFLQYDKNSPVAERYITFYCSDQSHEDPKNYPHVSIIDPRTGEQVKVWSGVPFPEATVFLIELSKFLDRYSLEDNSKNPVSQVKRPEKVIDVDRMTEEEMLQMAMQNSLESNGDAGPSTLVDPDELTRSVGVIPASGDSTHEAEPSTPTAATSQLSCFHKISSDRPHTEPANGTALTTRVQIRYPPSRIIRRFMVHDNVERIYEWLKADPIPGMEGVPFELKSMPQGTDLIEHLGETILEAGLANGTIIIEFLEL